MPTQTCQQTRREISDMLDGETADLPLETQRHLDGCGDCSGYFDGVRTLDGKLSEQVPVPAGSGDSDLPSGFHDRVLAAARESSAVESKVVAFPRWILPAAGAAAAVMIAFIALRGVAGDVDGPGAGEVVEVSPTGLPSGFESPIDVPAMTLAAGRGLEAKFGKEAEAIASDIEKIRGFFTSRVSVVGRMGL